MRYLGGKSRTANQIAGYIHTILEPNQTYYEPFCGACWVTSRVRANRMYASDANSQLIAMWQALQNGWIPPTHISEDEYNAAKNGKYADQPHLEAFIGFGCSFGGKWFGGYARDNRNRNYAFCASNALRDKLLSMYSVNYMSHSYNGELPPHDNMLIYCDPPYSNTTGYGAVGDFDSAAFWRWAQDMTLDGHTVVVSEYTAPAGWSCVVEMPTNTEIRTADNGRENRIERLFRYGDYKPLQPALPLFADMLGLAS